MYVGGIVGRAKNSTVSRNIIQEATIEGIVNNGKAYTGGFIGYAKECTSESNKSNSDTVDITGYGTVGGGYGFIVDSIISNNQVKARIYYYQIPGDATTTDSSHTYKSCVGGLIGISISCSINRNNVSGYLHKKTITNYTWVGSIAGFVKGGSHESNSADVSSDTKDVWVLWNHQVFYNNNDEIFGQRVS